MWMIWGLGNLHMTSSKGNYLTTVDWQGHAWKISWVTNYFWRANIQVTIPSIFQSRGNGCLPQQMWMLMHLSEIQLILPLDVRQLLFLRKCWYIYMGKL